MRVICPVCNGGGKLLQLELPPRDQQLEKTDDYFWLCKDYNDPGYRERNTYLRVCWHCNGDKFIDFELCH